MSVQLNKSNLSLYHQKYSLEDAYSKFQKISALDICSLLIYFAAYSGNSVQTFQDNLSVPSLKVKKSPWRWDRPGFPETSIRNSTLLNIPEEIRSHLRGCGSLKSRIELCCCYAGCTCKWLLWTIHRTNVAFWGEILLHVVTRVYAVKCYRNLRIRPP